MLDTSSYMMSLDGFLYQNPVDHKACFSLYTAIEFIRSKGEIKSESTCSLIACLHCGIRTFLDV